MPIVKFEGSIRDISYTSRLIPINMQGYNLDDFDINNSSSYGIINISKYDKLGFSKWVTPKRTRSYPFERIYNTYHLNTKKITIIPIIKDEGRDSSNNDRINFITYSWMNLLDIYIILAYYVDADKNSSREGHYITNQVLDNCYIKDKIKEISKYKMSALHWNTTHFEKDFDMVFTKAVESYQNISAKEQVKLHSFEKHLSVLENFRENNSFSIDKFRESTLPRSEQAASRESQTIHVQEFCEEGEKGVFFIKNNLGGVYHLTADEILFDNERKTYIIQESKNTISGKIPAESDLKDGLFKLILFSNISNLKLQGNEVKFQTRLKITGKLIGDLLLPNSKENINKFSKSNNLRPNKIDLLNKLNLEAQENNIAILLSSNE